MEIHNLVYVLMTLNHPIRTNLMRQAHSLRRKILIQVNQNQSNQVVVVQVLLVLVAKRKSHVMFLKIHVGYQPGIQFIVTQMMLHLLYHNIITIYTA